jgi:hypothetical protein
LKITREIKRCLRTAFGTTDTNAGAVTLSDALTALFRGEDPTDSAQSLTGPALLRYWWR